MNLGSRQMKSPKLYIVDSGLLSFLIGANERRIAEDGQVAGTMPPPPHPAQTSPAALYA